MHFLATVSQMFGGPSQLPTTTERVVIKSNQIVERTSDSKVGNWEEPPNIWLMVAKTHLSLSFWPSMSRNATLSERVSVGVQKLLKMPYPRTECLIPGK